MAYLNSIFSKNSTESIGTADFTSAEKSSGETILHWILKRPDPSQSYEQVTRLLPMTS
jgi:hypothetical protein